MMADNEFAQCVICKIKYAWCVDKYRICLMIVCHPHRLEKVVDNWFLNIFQNLSKGRIINNILNLSGKLAKINKQRIYKWLNIIKIWCMQHTPNKVNDSPEKKILRFLKK